MAASVVRAIDQDAAHADVAHVANGDLDQAAVCAGGRVASDRLGMAPSKRHRDHRANYQSFGPRSARKLLRVVGLERRSKIQKYTYGDGEAGQEKHGRTKGHITRKVATFASIQVLV